MHNLTFSQNDRSPPDPTTIPFLAQQLFSFSFLFVAGSNIAINLQCLDTSSLCIAIICFLFIPHPIPGMNCFAFEPTEWTICGKVHHKHVTYL